MSKADMIPTEKPEPTCDFCTEPTPDDVGIMHRARKFNYGVAGPNGIAIVTMDPDWWACPACHKHIIERNLEGLVERYEQRRGAENAKRIADLIEAFFGVYIGLAEEQDS